MVRAGEAMEVGLREVCQDIRIGKMLIRHHEMESRSKGPRVYILSLYFIFYLFLVSLL